LTAYVCEYTHNYIHCIITLFNVQFIFGTQVISSLVKKKKLFKNIYAQSVNSDKCMPSRGEKNKHVLPRSFSKPSKSTGRLIQNGKYLISLLRRGLLHSFNERNTSFFI